MHQQPAPFTFPCMPAPNMLGRRFAMMMMSGRVPDHVFGGTVFLASPTRPSPTQSRGFSLQRGEARPKGRVPGYPTKRGRKNFYLEELKLFLVKVSVLRLAGGIISAPCQDRFTPCPLPPSARPLLIWLIKNKAFKGFEPKSASDSNVYIISIIPISVLARLSTDLEQL